MLTRVCLLLSLIVALAACAPNSSSSALPPTLAVNAADSTPTGSIENGYPGLPIQVSESYPGQPEYVDVTLITPIAPGTAPETEPGTASISGVLVSRSTNVVIDVHFYLTRGEGPDQTFPPYLIGPDLSRGDIAGVVDDSGQFSMKDIPPGKYFMYVSSPYGWTEVETAQDNQNPRLLELTPDLRWALGEVLVTWP